MEDHHHTHNHVYQDDDLDDDDENDDSEPLNGAVPDDDPVDSDSSSDTDDADVTTTTTTTTVASVTVAIPSSIAPPSTSAVTVALPDPKRQRFDSTPPLPSSTSIVPVVTPTEKKPIDDSRRLFQRLWTDEDEIELLQGFLEYTANRGTTSSGHHHDTAAFYDQIKSKLQLEFNKNQLVEKLRRLKKKYRNVLSKMSSGKEFVFKSPHDQATFEISRKIWSNLASNLRNTVDFDDDEQQNPNPSLMAATQSPSSGGGGFVISHINLNNAATLSGGGDHKPPSNFDLMASPAVSAAAKLSSRKRPRVGSVAKMEDKFVRVNLQGGSVGGGGVGGNEGIGGINVNTNTTNNSNSNNININSSSSNVNVGPAMQGLIEETVRNCLSPMFKELINNAMNGGFKGIGALAMNAAPLSFGGINMGCSGGEIIDEKWRNQQILELEVYSKRLELVQEQIKQTLDELRSMGS